MPTLERPPADLGREQERAAASGTVEAHELVSRSQAGDTSAFGMIYARYVDQIFGFIHPRVRDHQLAEDLTSETFLRAFRNISSFTWQGRDIGAWLVTIARNLLIDHRRTKARRPEMRHIGLTYARRADVSTTDDPERATLRRLETAALLHSLRQLKAEHRDCLVLRFLQDYSVPDTARAMGKTNLATRALQYRAVQTLQGLLTTGNLVT